MKALLDNPLVSLIVVALVVVGAVDLLVDGALSKDFQVYVETLAIPVAGLAIGRGLAARKPG